MSGFLVLQPGLHRLFSCTSSFFAVAMVFEGRGGSDQKDKGSLRHHQADFAAPCGTSARLLFNEITQHCLQSEHITMSVLIGPKGEFPDQGISPFRLMLQMVQPACQFWPFKARATTNLR
jgi:hypothetical protein